MRSVRVTAAVIRRDGYILLARRSRRQSRPLLWEFPGGKVEAGEDDHTCLVRELREELGIETEVCGTVGVFPHEYEDISIDLAVYEVRILSGEPHAHEHDSLNWVRQQDLDLYELAEADVPAARQVAKS